MKRILRIMVGLLISPIMLIIGTFVWIFSDLKWIETIGKDLWNLINGNWHKLPE